MNDGWFDELIFDEIRRRCFYQMKLLLFLLLRQLFRSSSARGRTGSGVVSVLIFSVCPSSGHSHLIPHSWKYGLMPDAASGRWWHLRKVQFYDRMTLWACYFGPTYFLSVESFLESTWSNDYRCDSIHYSMGLFDAVLGIGHDSVMKLNVESKILNYTFLSVSCVVLSYDHTAFQPLHRVVVSYWDDTNCTFFSGAVCCLFLFSCSFFRGALVIYMY